MKSLRIVLVLPDPPLPFGNAGARWFYVLLKELVARGHRVTAISGAAHSAEVERVKELFPNGSYDVRCFPSEGGGWRGRLQRLRQPYSYVYSQAMRRALDAELARGFDILHLEQLWSGWLGLPHRHRTLINIHYSFSIDQSGRPAASWSERVARFRARRAERFLLRQYPHICTLSSRLRDYVKRINPAAGLHTIPLGLDCGLYPFEAPAAAEPLVGLIGSFNWTPSYLAAERLLNSLWPKIRASRPDARLMLVGRQARAAFASYASDPSIRIEENVPEIIPFFRQMAVMLYAPSVGSGMKTKILEAFALGTPVVTNAEGVEGLPVRDGVHAGLAEDDAGLVDRTVHLLGSQQRRQAQVLEARQLVESFCHPRNTVDQVEAAYGQILKSVR